MRPLSPCPRSKMPNRDRGSGIGDQKMRRPPLWRNPRACNSMFVKRPTLHPPRGIVPATKGERDAYPDYVISWDSQRRITDCSDLTTLVPEMADHGTRRPASFGRACSLPTAGSSLIEYTSCVPSSSLPTLFQPCSLVDWRSM